MWLKARAAQGATMEWEIPQNDNDAILLHADVGRFVLSV